MTSAEIRRFFFDLSEKDVEDAERMALVRHAFGKRSDWDDLLKSRLIVILAEAQSGKTHECQAQKRALWDAGEPAFYVDLSSIANQPWRDLRSPEETERLEEWRRTETLIATIFLDSVDELRLTQGKFQAALRNVANDLNGHIARVRVVLTSRPLPVDRDLFLSTFAAPKPQLKLTEDAFAELAMGAARDSDQTEEPPDVRYVSLLPLSTEDVMVVAAARGVSDIEAFMKGLESAAMMQFMRRPQDVIEAASAWEELGGKFGTHAEQVAFDIRARLKPNQNRNERQLADDRALDGAKRLALAVVLTQRLTIRHDVNNDPGDASTVVDPAVILPDWRDDDRKALLERGLFGFASYGRVRFHNRLAFEFLAAERLHDLVEHGLSRKAVRRLLAVQTAQGFAVVRPSLRDVAAWLSLRQRWVFELVNELDPALLMNLGDPASLAIEQRQKVLTTYIDCFGKGGWRGLSVPQIQIHRLADESLAGIVNAQFEAIENSEVRQVLLELIGVARLNDCADVAKRVLQAPQVDHYEKVDALEALIALADPALTSIANELSLSPGTWDQRFARSAICRLFPRHMTIEQFVAALGLVQETRSIGSELSRILPTRIDTLAVEKLEELRRGLTALVEDGLHFDATLHAAKNNRPHLVHLLSATCALLLSNGALSPGHAGSAALVGQLARGIRSEDAVPPDLARAVTSASPAFRAALFEADVLLLRKLRPNKPAFDIFFELGFNGSLTLRSEDEPWIRELLADTAKSADLRSAALQMEMFAFAGDVEDRQSYLSALRPLIADDAGLRDRLEDRLKPRVPSRQERRWAICNKRRTRQEQRRRAKAKASWVMFWRDLNNDPAGAFSPEQVEATAQNLWRVMQRGGARSRASGWDRQLIEETLGKEVADRLREALMPVWRREKPPLSSERKPEERDSYFVRWGLALAAISAEAEDLDWANRLIAEEAEIAVRYASHSSGNYPAWLDALAVVHGDVVERVLGRELSWLLSFPVEDGSRSIMLQNIYYASPEVASLFLPRLRSWLQSTGGMPGESDGVHGAAARLEQVTDILLKFGDETDRGTIGEMSSNALSRGSHEALVSVLLPALFAVDPEKAVGWLESICSSVAVSRESVAVSWFSRLFGHHGRRGVGLSHPGMTPSLLLRLLRLAYQHVERDKDTVHEGSFSPDMRDDAEHGRSALLNAVIQLGGAEGWQAKQEIASDPKFADLRDRLHALAVEKSAAEADNLAMRPEEVVKLDVRDEPGPRSPAEMFALMMDRLEDLTDHLLGDGSPREMWAAVKGERVMRRAIAQHLEDYACGAYSVGQEGITAEEKETDIRLRSAVNAVEGVIELKIGDKAYSAEQLRAVISEQLVAKYLAPADRRAGCLLITRASRSRWQHPDTGDWLDFPQLVAMLSKSAKALQDSFPGEIHIGVVGLDLKPRLSTEQKTKAARRKAPKRRVSARESRAIVQGCSRLASHPHMS